MDPCILQEGAEVQGEGEVPASLPGLGDSAKQGRQRWDVRACVPAPSLLGLLVPFHPPLPAQSHLGDVWTSKTFQHVPHLLY